MSRETGPRSSLATPSDRLDEVDNCSMGTTHDCCEILIAVVASQGSGSWRMGPSGCRTGLCQAHAWYMWQVLGTRAVGASQHHLSAICRPQIVRALLMADCRLLCAVPSRAAKGCGAGMGIEAGCYRPVAYECLELMGLKMSLQSLLP